MSKNPVPDSNEAFVKLLVLEDKFKVAWIMLFVPSPQHVINGTEASCETRTTK